jgi:hypothetical protein
MATRIGAYEIAGPLRADAIKGPRDWPFSDRREQGKIDEG